MTMQTKQLGDVNHALHNEVVKENQMSKDRREQSKPQFRKYTKRLNKHFEMLRKQLQLPSSTSKRGILEKAQQRAESLRGEHSRLLREHHQLSQENQRLLSNLQWYKDNLDFSKSHDIASQNQPTQYAWPTYYGDYNA